MDTEKVKLYDPTNNTLYDILLSREDAQRARTDNLFARNLLHEANVSTSDHPDVDETATGTTECTASISAHTDNGTFEFLDCGNDEGPLNIEKSGDHTSQVQENDGSLCRWTSACVLLLLETYKLKQKYFPNAKRSQKKIWEEIAQELTEQGYAVTGPQCSSKLRSLKKTYKSVKHHNNKSGIDKRNWQFFKLMDEIIANNEVAVVSSSGFSSKHAESNDSEVESDRSDGCFSKSNKSTLIFLLEKRFKQIEEHQENRAKRHKQRMEMDKKWLEVLQKLAEK